MTGSKVVYAQIEDYLVFLLEGRAYELAALRAAIHSSKTWGELQARVAKNDYIQAVQLAGYGQDSLNSVPKSDDKFEPNRIEAIVEMDWPPHPCSLLGEWLPAEIVSRFKPTYGQFGPSMWFSTSDTEEILSALRALGFECEKDEALVFAASGWRG